MQVTGGQLRGRKVTVPKDVKPTLSKVRESVFNVLFSELGDFSGLKFLDMFCGSGIMALEAVSRGFEVVAIEKDLKNAKLAKQNISPAGVKVLASDALRLVKKLDFFDVIYIDPPWEFEYGEIIALAAQKLSTEGILVCEFDKRKQLTLEDIPSNVKLFKEKMYGRCCLWFLRRA